MEICEAFPIMENGELNHAHIEIMPHIPYFERKSKKITAGRETTRARQTPTPAGSRESSKLRNLQETARREVDLSSSYLARQLKTWSNSEPSAALGPGPTYLYTYLCNPFETSQKEISTRRTDPDLYHLW